MARQIATAELVSRLLTKAEAAAYCSLEKSGFMDWVRKGRLPGPIPGTYRWDRLAIDRALDKLSGLVRDPSPDALYNEWKAGQDENAA